MNLSSRPARPRRYVGWRWLALTATLALPAMSASACATSVTPPSAPSPAEIPELERRVAADPGDPGTLMRLGAAYRAADRTEDAIEVLERARGMAPDEGGAVLLLGLAYEDAERFGDARMLYQAHLDDASDSALTDRIRDRLPLVRRGEFRQLVARALAQEEALAGEPAPTTIAVFPFHFAGGDPEIEPLRHALGALISTDLAQLERFSVLDRMHVQALLDEVQLSESGLVDPATAVRGGRLLGAGRIVQGRLAGDEQAVDIEAAVVRVSPDAGQVQPVGDNRELERFFEMQKAIVFGLLDEMGVQLTAAERERLEERDTDNLQALLAYGRGLDASARGEFGEAAAHFQQAASLDPDFASAGAEAQEAESIASAQEVEVATTLPATAVPEPVLPQPLSVVDVAAGAATRDLGPEATGTEGFTPSTGLTIIFLPPGGGQ